MPPRRSEQTASSSSTNTTRSERNQYIPAFITKKPFFLDSTTPTATADGGSIDYLEHQRLAKPIVPESKYEDRRKRVVVTATKYRKGACVNCGAMGHAAKECMSRPRKSGARWTGDDIEADVEREGKREGGWDEKRDRYAAYDVDDYQGVVEQFEQMEKIRTVAAGDPTGDGTRYEEESQMGRTQATSTRTLRIREDVAPYLRSLDPESAKYDPKTRRMVDSGAVDDGAAEMVMEREVRKGGGERADFERAQRLAWESQEPTAAMTTAISDSSAAMAMSAAKTGRIHLQANPTQAARMIETLEREAKEKTEKRRKMLLEEYGGADHLRSTGSTAATIPNSLATPTVAGVASEMLVGITAAETFVEYDPETGLPILPPSLTNIKNGKKHDGSGAAGTVRSKYDEDVYPLNHSSVWGSWWFNHVWGYYCCHSTVKGSYCTGKAGREAWEEERRRKLGIDTAQDDEEPVEDGDDGGDGDVVTESNRKRKLVDERSEMERKRQNAADDHEKMMEDYRRQQALKDDPLFRG